MAFQGDSIYWVEVEKIVPNPFQPRREFDESKLKELAESVRMYGILQPLTVTRNEIQREDGTFYTQYELIAGERRLRASKLAELSQVPVIIREGDDSEQEKLELAIIENLQREDLNAVDRALAFKQLAESFGLSHTLVAKKVGRSREYVSNSIRLLALPEYMLSALKQGEMTEGHARTLLMLNDKPEEQDVVFREILLKKLSVRELEKIVRKIATDKVRKKNPDEFDPELIEMEKRFMETLGTRVQIQKTDYGGKLTIDYFSVEELEDMLVKMKLEQAGKMGGVEMSDVDILSKHTPLVMNKDDEPKKDIDNSIEKTPLAVTHNKENKIDSTEEIRESVVLDTVQNTETELLPAKESFVKLDTPLSRPQIVAHSHHKSPVYIKPKEEVEERVEKEPVSEVVKDNSFHSSDGIGSENNHNRPTHSVSEISHENPITQPAMESNTPNTPKPQSDDSGLYSIRNFSV